MKRRLIGVTTAVLGTLLLSGVGVQTAAAADPPAVPTEVMLPLFGAQLTFTITTGPGGALSDVSVDAATGVTATQLRPHKVVFEVANTTDPAGDPGKVVVRSKHGGQSVSTRGGSLADVSGDGSWSGDVFGTGAASTVDFTIGGTDDTPDITVNSTGGEAAVVGDVQHSTGDDDEGTESSARVTVTFTNASKDMSRALTIRVKVETDADSNTSAKVTVALGRLKGLAVDADTAAGPHTWNGVLCDGSAATIDYVVAADGSVSSVLATPDTDRVKAEGGKIEVRFSHDERVRIRVRADNGQITINVDERIRCDSPNPTTNATTTSSVADDDQNGNEDEAHEGGGHHGGHHDDDTTTSAAAAPVAGA
jgi:hypothetical protein